MDEYRWIEIQFYYICSDIYALNNEFPDLVDYIQLVNNLTEFSFDKVVNSAQKVLTLPSYRPTREEVIVLGAKAGIKMLDIKKYVPINNRDYYSIIEKARKNPPYFYLRFNEDELIEIQKFVKFHNKFKEVGI